MNKVVNINLGGIPFTIDDDAYEHLRRYLDVIYHHFRGTEGYEEITSDIESRLGELFQEGLGNRPIVKLKDVEEAIKIMGTPEEFGAADEATSTSNNTSFTTGKRMFRNPDDVVIGGVCSGIAAYFGIQDPIWIRLVFVALALTGTFGIPIYLVLWAIIPKAKSSADKLAMRGEPINVSSIGKVVQKEFENLSREVSEIADDLSPKDKQGIVRDDKISQGVSDFVQAGGNVLQEGARILGKIWRPLLILVGSLLIFSLAMGWVSAVIGIFSIPPYLDLLLTDAYWANRILPINLLLLIGIPITFLVLLIARLTFRSRASNKLKWSLLGVWALNLVCIVFFLVQTGKQFETSGQVTSSETLDIQGDTLQLAAIDLIPRNKRFEIDNQVFFQDDAVTYRGIQVRLKEAEDDQWKLDVHGIARGQNRGEAQSRAGAIVFDPQIAGNTLSLPNALTISRGEKFRAQRIKADLFVPKGKFVAITKSAQPLVRGNKHHNHSNLSQHIYQMTPEGINCSSCDQLSSAEVKSESLSRNDYQDFQNIQVSGPIKVRIEKQDNYEIQLTGPKAHGLDQVSISQEGGVLSISSSASTLQVPRLFVGLPSLQSLQLNHTDDVMISGLKEEVFQLASVGEQDIKLEMDKIQSFQLSQAGETEVDLNGIIGELILELEGKARLDAEEAEVKVAEIKLANQSKALLPSSTQLDKQEIDQTSTVIQKN